MNTKAVMSSYSSGLLFGLGLGISGMTDANKVIAFLTLDSSWNPALMLVMAGAIGIHLALYKFITNKEQPLFDSTFHIPTNRQINSKLVIGSLLFGLGWGMGGICPGPGLVSLFSFNMNVVVFVTAMLVGMFVFKMMQPKTT